MDKQKVIDTMEDVVRSYREQLAKNDDSSVSNIGNAAKMGFESLRAWMSGSEADKHTISMFKDYADNFETALKKHNRDAAAKALDDMEKSIQGFRIH